MGASGRWNRPTVATGHAGNSDVLWRNDSGQVSIWEMNGATITNNHAVAALSSDWAGIWWQSGSNRSRRPKKNKARLLSFQ